MDDQLAKTASDGQRLLYAVTTEAVREVKIGEARRQSNGLFGLGATIRRVSTAAVMGI
jgi:hypothetical protein